MGKKLAPNRRPVPPDVRPQTHEFPETRTGVLEQAAAGDWEQFLNRYLPACCREIVRGCRGRVPVSEAADLLQELVVRLMQDGEGRPSPIADGHAGAPEPAPRGNIPVRFLARRAGGGQSARFRTYLKRVICNLISESARRSARAPTPVDPVAVESQARWVEDSVATCVDRQWVAVCVEGASRQLLNESLVARTIGRRRRFEVFYLTTVRGLSPAAIADRLGLDRSTVAGQLGEARQRFVGLLAQETGISDPNELKSHLAADPSILLNVLSRVWEEGANREAPAGGP